MTSFGKKWVAAGVCKGVREAVLSDPVKVLRGIGGGVSAQIFDASPIISVKQIHAAAVAAYLSFKAGVNISRRFEIELLLRLSADTQINRALERIGVKPSSREVGFCVIGDDKEIVRRSAEILRRLLGGESMDEMELSVEERIRHALDFYGIKWSELESVQADSPRQAALLLILERIAILDVER